MIDYTKHIAEKIANITNLNIEELESYIEIPPKPEMGDYAFPCFKLAKELEKLTGLTSRCTVLGYMQRGGTPTAYDRVLSTKYGAKAMELALEGKFGVLTVIQNGKLSCVPLEEVIGNNKEIGAVQGGTADSNVRLVSMDDELLRTARDIGICLGD